MHGLFLRRRLWAPLPPASLCVCLFSYVYVFIPRMDMDIPPAFNRRIDSALCSSTQCSASVGALLTCIYDAPFKLGDYWCLLRSMDERLNGAHAIYVLYTWEMFIEPRPRVRQCVWIVTACIWALCVCVCNQQKNWPQPASVFVYISFWLDFTMHHKNLN